MRNYRNSLRMLTENLIFAEKYCLMKQTTTVRFLNMLLALLGFAGISSSCDDNKHLCEYGTPSADFSISGKVVDQKGNPLKDIVVECGVHVGQQGEIYHRYGIDTVHTKADGSFEKAWLGFSRYSDKIYVIDEDGPENGGEFEDKLYDPFNDFKRVKDGSGHWYEGAFEAKDLVIKLDNK